LIVEAWRVALRVVYMAVVQRLAWGLVWLVVGTAPVRDVARSVRVCFVS
jgi:hypothetical protein